MTEVGSGIINSVSLFVSLIEIGDEIWYIKSRNRIPGEVMGPFIVFNITTEGNDHRVVLQNSDGKISSHLVSDLTNIYHGVFLIESEAEEYLISQWKKRR